MNEEIRVIINKTEVLALEMETNIDNLINSIVKLEEYQDSYEDDEKLISKEMKNNEIISRVQQKMDDLGDKLY